MEQDTTEHHPDPQPLENEPPVSQTEAGYQKIRAELHEARKNIPHKNPVDVGKQLAAVRGEYAEDISDPNDPKWVPNNYSASNQGEKEEVVPEEKQPAAEPEAVTRNADGTFDVSALFPPPSNQTEKTEARTERDGETPKESNQQETAGDTGQEITTDGGSGTGGDEAGEAADPVENGNFTVPDDIQPGIYYDIPNEAYHAGPGVSKSQLDDIADTPAIYLWRKNAPVDTEKTKSLDTGTAFHCRVSFHQERDSVLPLLHIHAVAPGVIRIFRCHRIHDHRRTGPAGFQLNGAVLYRRSRTIFQYAGNKYWHITSIKKPARRQASDLFTSQH